LCHPRAWQPRRQYPTRSEVSVSNKTIYPFNYVYRITNIVTRMHYYGVRSCIIEPRLDLGYKYFSTASSIDGLAFRADQKVNSLNYRYKIVGLFETRELAIKREILLHNMYDVARNPKFYNQAKQTSTGFDQSGIPSSTLQRATAKLLCGNRPFGNILVTRLSDRKVMDIGNFIRSLSSESKETRDKRKIP